MNSQIKKLNDISDRRVGTKESPAGSNNVDCNTAYYGKPVSGDSYPWCCAEQWYQFKLAGLSHLFPKTALCLDIYNYAKKNNRFVAPKDIQIGDVVLYKFVTTRNKNAANHIGRCIDVDDKYYYVNEGNTSVTSDDNGGAVMNRKRLKTMPEIVGGYRPNYDTEEDDIMTQDEFNAMFEKAFAAYNAKLAKQPPHDWAKDAWKRVCAYDTAKGQKLFDGTNPQGDASREQLAVLFERLGLTK